MRSINTQKPGGSFLGSGFSAENFDAFERLRVSAPTTVFESQLTYNLQPLILEQITSGTGAAIAHDTTNRCATLTFASTPNTGKAYMQSYEYFQYQPGRSQLVKLTFNFNESVAGATKFAGLSDGVNGFEFQQIGGGVARFVIYSGTTNGNQIVNQADWNGDRLDGTGISGLTLDLTKGQLLVIDFQALYAGAVRMGFDIGGRIHICHTFFHSNLVATPYIQQACLPVRVGMTATATVSTTMRMICMAVITEGGSSELLGVANSITTSITAGSGADTHAISIRPKTTFNSIANRTNFALFSVSALVTGTFPVLLKICIGQAISGTTTYNDVNATYSAFEYNTAGTLSGSPALVMEQLLIPASGSQAGGITNRQFFRNPISLNAAGAVRANGTLTLIAQGIGGSSACRFAVNWKEIR